MPMVRRLDVVARKVQTCDSKWQIFYQEQLVCSCQNVQGPFGARREAKARERESYNGAAAGNCNPGRTIPPELHDGRGRPSAPAPSSKTTPSSPKGRNETEGFGLRRRKWRRDREGEKDQGIHFHVLCSFTIAHV